MYAEIGYESDDYAKAVINYGANVADAKAFNILVSQIECDSETRLV